MSPWLLYTGCRLRFLSAIKLVVAVCLLGVVFLVVILVTFGHKNNMLITAALKTLVLVSCQEGGVVIFHNVLLVSLGVVKMNTQT